ncbi:hypothetical protein S245_010788 [Arachis hypogaea]
MAAAFRSSLSHALTPHSPLVFFFSLILTFTSPTHRTISHQLTPLSLCLQRQNLVVATVAYSLPLHCCQKRISQFLALFTLSADLSIFPLRFAIAVTACSPPLHCCQKPVLQHLILLSYSKSAVDSPSLSLGSEELFLQLLSFSFFLFGFYFY